MENTNETIDQVVRRIEKECLSGKISPIAAVEQMNQAMGGITSVCYKTGLTFKLDNQSKRIGLNCTGLPRGQQENLYGLAVCAYMKAQQNGSIKPGEVHIGHGCSTKHYMAGIKAIYQKLLSTANPAYAGGTA